MGDGVGWEMRWGGRWGDGVMGWVGVRVGVVDGVGDVMGWGGRWEVGWEMGMGWEIWVDGAGWEM